MDAAQPARKLGSDRAFIFGTMIHATFTQPTSAPACEVKDSGFLHGRYRLFQFLRGGQRLGPIWWHITRT